MSGNAPASGGGVSWQADIPGLSSLILNLGAAGLKSFAQAGVDVHTVVCMGGLAVQCQASTAYRKELNQYRQEQRKQSQWVYKVVEIGAGTNFVADTLLKKRAGENVIALMSSILTVMSDTACDNVVLKLFEASATSLDCTPGLGQLRCFRETLMPLVRKSFFKERVFQYHQFVRQLLVQEKPMSNMRSAYEGVPDVATAVEVILSLTALMQGGPHIVFEYHGLSGAGWVLAYARHVLELPTCILASASSSVPISGNYKTARVFVYIFESEGRKCQLLIEGRPERLFQAINSIEGYGQHGWVINFDNLHLLDSVLPSSDPTRQDISWMARSLVNDYLAQLCKHLNPLDTGTHSSNFGLTNYPTYCLPSLSTKAQNILSSFGFEALPSVEQNSGLWHLYIQSHGPPSDILLCMVECACWLAFTDWFQQTRTLSLNFLENHSPSRKCLVFEMPLLEAIDRGNPSYWSGKKWLSIRDEDVCKATMDIILGGREGSDHYPNEYDNSDVLAFEHRGYVFVQNAALRQRLDFDACFLSVISGAIIAERERRPSMYSITERKWQSKLLMAAGRDRKGEFHHNSNSVPAELKHPSITIRSPQESAYQPKDSFRGICITTRVDTRTGTLDVGLHQNVLYHNDVYPVPGPGSSSKALRQLLVTEPCEHKYDNELPTENEIYGPRIRSDPPTQRIELGLFIAGSLEEHESAVWLQSVDQNPCGQWLAYQTSDRNDILTIIQRGCCLPCVRVRIEKAWEFLSHLRKDSTQSLDTSHGFTTVCVVHGRLAGEPMELASSERTATRPRGFRSDWGRQ